MAESPSAYLPQDRRAALARGETLPERASGAALFADISGFTPLTESLAQSLGPRRGAEVLSSILNEVYGALIAEVELLGGSVVGFSGDAITCWFDERLPDPALRAVACSLAMQRAVARAPDGAVRTDLAIKVAVTAGPVRRFLAGDARHGRLDVIAGGTLDRLAAAEHLAGRGEVVVDSQTAALLDGELTIACWREGEDSERVAVVAGVTRVVEPAPWEPPEPPADQSDWWLPRSVAERLRGGLGAFPADLRPVVALFVSFGGIDYDADEDAPYLLDAFVRHVQAVATGYGGALLQLTTGDKGSYMVVSFGAPSAHDDDAARALGCARDLIVRAQQLGYVREPRIGVALGGMYCGAYGGPNRRCYGILSDATNLAARLMQAAPAAEIRCDGATARAAGRAWLLDELPALRVKGKSAPIRVFRPVGRRDAPGETWGAEAPLVGRDVELARVDAALDQALSGTCGVLLIEGEAGIGKSRLVAELARRAAARGLQCLRGRADSIEQRTPYHAWQGVFTALLGLEPGQDGDQRREQARRRVEELAPRLTQRAPLLNDLLPLGLPETPLTAALDVALRHESLQGLLVALLRAEAHARPLTLLLEDAQWMDGPSWELADSLARAVQSDDALLLAVTYRPFVQGADAGALSAPPASLPGATTLTLGGLPDDALDALVAARIGLPRSELPAAVGSLVRARAGGNPFFAEELALALGESGLVTVTQELGPRGEPGPVRCVVDPGLSKAGAVLPDTVQGLILARIDRLPPDQQLAIKIAAVIGRSFAEHPLHATLSRYRDMPLPVLRSHLVDLAVHELTVLEELRPELTYGFKHLVTHEVAYELLLFAQRRELHRSVAEWYEARGDRLSPEVDMAAVLSQPRPATDMAPETAATLAYHYRLAETPDREWRYAALAGALAASRYANAEAAALLSRAIEIAPRERGRERFALLQRLELAQDMLGEREAQRATLAALAALADDLGDDRLRAAVALRQASFAEVTGDYPAALASADLAVALAARAGADDQRAAGAFRRGRVLILEAEYDAARGSLEEAIRVARGAGLAGLAGDGLRNLGLAALNRGAYVEAQDYAASAITAFREAGDRRGEAMAIANVGAAAYFQADYDRARQAFEQALHLAQEIGDRLTETDSLVNIGNVARDQGAYEPARASYEQALALCRQIRDRWGESSSLNGLGVVALAQGRYEAALAHQGEAVALSHEIAGRIGEAIARANLAEVELQVGRYERARVALECALALFREAGDRRNESWVLALLGQAAECAGTYAEAAALADEAARGAAEVGASSVEAIAYLVRAYALRGLGQPRAAAEAALHSLALRDALGEHPLALDSLAAYVDALAAAGTSAEAAPLAEELLAACEAPGGLEGAAEPFRAYLACHLALDAADHPRALAPLEAGVNALQKRAGAIADPSLRRSFLEDVPAHRRLVGLWAQEGKIA